MTAGDARARAAHCREIARQMTDAQAREGLLELAAEYETLAEKIADEPPEFSRNRTTAAARRPNSRAGSQRI